MTYDLIIRTINKNIIIGLLYMIICISFSNTFVDGADSKELYREPINKFKLVNCSKYTSCGVCVHDKSCGWCTDTLECLNIEAKGTCRKWNVDNCSIQCGSYLNCKSCIIDDGCSWCAGHPVSMLKELSHTFRTSSCVLGRVYDPKYICAAWHNRTCSDCQIKDQSNCGDCIKFGPECGWCPINLNCEEGDNDGPFDDLNCIGVWLKNISQCTTTTGTTTGKVTTGHMTTTTTGKLTTTGKVTTTSTTTSTTTTSTTSSTTAVSTTGKLTTGNITTSTTTGKVTTTGTTSTTGHHTTSTTGSTTGKLTTGNITTSTTTGKVTTTSTTGKTSSSTTSGNSTSTTGKITTGHVTSGKLTTGKTTTGHSTTGKTTTGHSTTGKTTTSSSTSTTGTTTCGESCFTPLVPPTTLNPEPNYDDDIYFMRDLLIGIAGGAVVTIIGSIVFWRFYKSGKKTSYQVIKGNDKKL